jgi:aminomethyltransferase
MAEHKHCRARRRCSTCRTWASCGWSATTPPRAGNPGAGGRGRPAVGKQRYAFFTNASGGMLDDLMIVGRAARFDDLFLVVNAGCKDADTRHLHHPHRPPLPGGADARAALLALQGPKAVDALARLNPAWRADLHDRRRVRPGRRRLLRHPLGLHRRGRLRDLGAGRRRPWRWPARCWPSPRSSPPAWARATRCAWKPACACTATTSTTTTSPVEAGLTWAIQKVRRPVARAPAATRAPPSSSQLAGGAAAQARRPGRPGAVPVREGAPIVDAHGHKLGPSPAARWARRSNQPIAMAYLPSTTPAAARGVRRSARQAPADARDPDALRAAPLPSER